MGAPNSLSGLIRTPLRAAWASTGLAAVIAGWLVARHHIWTLAEWLARATGESGAVALLTVGLVAALANALVASIAAVIIGFRGTREIRSKLAMVAEASELYAAGKLNYRMQDSGSDDLSMIAQNLNLMAERLYDQVTALHEAARQQDELQKSLEAAAVLRERERVSRELHDRVSQELFGLSMLSKAAAKVREQDPEQALRLLPEIEELARHAQGAMRALLLELRPLELTSRSLIPALQELTLELSARTSIRIGFRHTFADGLLQKLPDAVEDALFLIAQEALVNALKHAEPGEVRVELNVEQARVVLRVLDDGNGFVPARGKWTSVGLRSIQERAESLGGTVRVKSAVGKGTEITCIIPRIDEG